MHYNVIDVWKAPVNWLADPPSDYPYPSTDILGGLDDLASKVSSGSISSQYVLDEALNKLVTSAHEGHFYASFCSLSAIQYIRAVQLVSVSRDGIEVPELYVLGMSDNRSRSKTF